MSATTNSLNHLNGRPKLESTFPACSAGVATWKDGIPVYAEKGIAALEEWLAKDGVRNIGAVNDCLKRAKPWWTIYGAQRPSDLLG